MFCKKYFWTSSGSVNSDDLSLEVSGRATSWSGATVARKTDEYAEPLSAMCGSLRGPALQINVQKLRASTKASASTAGPSCPFPSRGEAMPRGLAPATQRRCLGDRVQRFSHPRDFSGKEPRNDTTFRRHLKTKSSRHAICCRPERVVDAARGRAAIPPFRQPPVRMTFCDFRRSHRAKVAGVAIDAAPSPPRREFCEKKRKIRATLPSPVKRTAEGTNPVGRARVQIHRIMPSAREPVALRIPSI